MTSSPGTINCGVTCVNTFNSGTDITLTATPATNYNFGGGSCAASGATCILTMNTNDIVSASSSQTPPPVMNIPRGGKIRLAQSNVNPPPTGLLEMPSNISGTQTVDVGTGPHTIDLWVANTGCVPSCQPFATFTISVSDGTVSPIQVTSGTRPMTITTTGNDVIQHFILRGNWGINVSQIFFNAVALNSLNAIFYGNERQAGVYYDGIPYITLGTNSGQGWSAFSPNIPTVPWYQCDVRGWLDCLPKYTLTESTISDWTFGGVRQSPNLLSSITQAGGTIGLPKGTFTGAGKTATNTFVTGAGVGSTILDLGHSTGSGTGADYSPFGGKAAFGVENTGFSVSNLTVHGAKVGGAGSSGLNGAAVMFEGYGGTISNVDFYDNQEGVRGGASIDGKPIIIKDSHIHNNGSRNQFTHEIYIADGPVGAYYNNIVEQGERSTHALKTRTLTSTVEGGHYSGCLDPSAYACGSVMEASQGGHFNILGFQTETVGSLGVHSGDVLTLTILQNDGGTSIVSKAPSGTSLTTSDGTWSWGAAAGGGNYNILLNGSSAGNGAAVQMQTFRGALYAKNAANQWYVWNGAGYTRLPGNPDRGASPTVVTSTVAAGPPTAARAATAFYNALKSNSTLATWGFDFSNQTPAAVNVYTPYDLPSDWTITPSVTGAGHTTTLTQATSGVTIVIPAKATPQSNGTMAIGYSPEGVPNGKFGVNVSDVQIQNHAPHQPRISSWSAGTINFTNCSYTGTHPMLYEGWTIANGRCTNPNFPLSTPSSDGTTSSAPGGASVTSYEGVWTWGAPFGGGNYNLLLNGSPPIDVGAGAVMKISNGNFYVQNAAGAWYRYLNSFPGNTFASAPAPP